MAFQESQSLAFLLKLERVHVLVLSLNLPSSTWVVASVPIEELRDMYQINMHIP